MRSDTAPLIDESVFRMVCEALPVTRKAAILEAFAADLRHFSCEIREACDAGDAERTSRARHALLGAAGNLGALAIVSQLDAFKSPRSAGAQSASPSLEALVEQTISRMETLSAPG